MKLDVNLDAVEDGDFDTLPPGNYAVEVTAYKMDKSEAGQFIRWTLKPMDPPEGRFGNLFLSTWLHAEALWVVKKLLKALGFEWNKDGTFDPEDVIGCTCELPVINAADDKTKRVFANVDNRGTFLPLT